MIAVDTEPSLNILPAPEEVRIEFPLTGKQSAFIENMRSQVEAVLSGWDRRRLLIVGPCSIHDLNSARDYAQRFRLLAEKVSDHFLMIMRTYIEKSRTSVGWKGMLYDPDLDGSYHLLKGIRQTRAFLVELAEMGVPTASELLEINTTHYYADCLTWGCIGARTSASPPHRQLAASLDLPIGFKNSIDGNVDPAIYGVVASSKPQIYLGLSTSGQLTRVKTEGNSLCHVVLRGGEKEPNYQLEKLHFVLEKCRNFNLNERLIIDCSHDNCGKKALQQKQVFETLIDHLVANPYLPIAGLMLESHLFEGSQPLIFPLRYGVSITDPCLSWETTESLILTAYSRVDSSLKEAVGPA